MSDIKESTLSMTSTSQIDGVMGTLIQFLIVTPHSVGNLTQSSEKHNPCVTVTHSSHTVGSFQYIVIHCLHWIFGLLGSPSVLKDFSVL